MSELSHSAERSGYRPYDEGPGPSSYIIGLRWNVELGVAVLSGRWCKVYVSEKLKQKFPITKRHDFVHHANLPTAPPSTRCCVATTVDTREPVIAIDCVNDIS